MSRFFLSKAADRDIDDILEYIDTALPRVPRQRIGRDIQKALKSIAANPYLGILQSEFTRLAGTEVRSRLVLSYRIFYTYGPPAPRNSSTTHLPSSIEEWAPQTKNRAHPHRQAHNPFRRLLMPTLELSRELVEKIDQGAQQTGESHEAFLREAVLARLEDLEDIAVATERLQNPAGTISLGELKTSLGLDD